MPIFVRNSPSPFPTFPFYKWGRYSWHRGPFVQTREAAVTWMIAYLGVGERMSLATFKIVLLCCIFCCLSWWCWYISIQKLHVDFILRRFFLVGHFTLYLRYLCVCVCPPSLIIIKRRIWWLTGSSFWIIPYILSLVFHKTKTLGVGLIVRLEM